MTCCKLPPIWWWRLRTFLGGFGRNHPLFFCGHGAVWKLTNDWSGWHWRPIPVRPERPLTRINPEVA